jgi:hypothetical protein
LIFALQKETLEVHNVTQKSALSKKELRLAASKAVDGVLCVRGGEE